MATESAARLGGVLAVLWLLGIPVGRLVFIIKSAHIYDSESEYMQNVVEAA